MECPSTTTSTSTATKKGFHPGASSVEKVDDPPVEKIDPPVEKTSDPPAEKISGDKKEVVENPRSQWLRDFPDMYRMKALDNKTYVLPVVHLAMCCSCCSLNHSATSASCRVVKRAA